MSETGNGKGRTMTERKKRGKRRAKPLTPVAMAESRINGIQEAMDRLLTIPAEERSAWVRGQIRYWEAELVQMRRALALLKGEPIE